MHLNAKLVSLFLNSNQILIPVKLYSIFVTLEVGKKLKWSHLNQKITYLTRIGTGFEYKQTNKQKKSYSKTSVTWLPLFIISSVSLVLNKKRKAAATSVVIHDLQSVRDGLQAGRHDVT